MTRIAAALALLSLLAGVARAEPPDVAARQKVQRASELLEQGNATEALVLLQEAYALVPDPSHLYNLSVAYQAAGRDGEAVEGFERFLADARDVAPTSLEDARTQVERLRPRLVAIDVHCEESGATIRLDGRDRAVTPAARPLWTAPGAHRLTVEKPGFVTFEAPVSAAAGERVNVRADLVAHLVAPTAAPSPATPLEIATPAPRPRLTRRPWFWAAVGTAVLAGVATALIIARSGPSSPTCPSEI